MQGPDSLAPIPIPLSYLVLHKLKQWDESRALNNPHDEQSTRPILKELTTLLRALRSGPEFHHDPTYDQNLQNESAARVDRFLAVHNIYGKEWRQMGFGKGPKPRVNSGSTSAGAVSGAPVQSRWSNHSLMHIRWLAAQTTVATLAELGLPCAIFGSMACKLYGNQRLPNDVDILVLPPPDRASLTQEEIKALIVRHAPPNYHFVLKPARDPKATYKVLYFVAKPRPSVSTMTHSFASMDLHDTADDDDDNNDDNISQEFTLNSIHIPRRLSTKVDILLPGVMHLPALPTSIITHHLSLPLVPFPVLLLQKLQGWADHCAATEARYRAKINVDALDLEWCLNWGNVKRNLLKHVININNGSRKERWKAMWSDRRMFSEEFEQLSRVRVGDFCEVHARLREAWKTIGFDA